MVGCAVAAFFLSLFCGLDQTARFIRQTDAVVGEQDKFPIGFFSRRNDDGLFPVALFRGADTVIEF